MAHCVSSSWVLCRAESIKYGCERKVVCMAAPLQELARGYLQSADAQARETVAQAREMARFRATASMGSLESNKYGSRRHCLPGCLTSAPFSPSSCHLSSPFLLNPLSSLNTRLCAAPSSSSPSAVKEEVFFDGGPHIGDLLTNLVFGLTLLWLPLTLASVFRALFLRYRFTNLRVTVMSGLTGSDRKDFSYKVIKDVKYVPRFIGEWGDVVITLSDGTQVELKSVPRFREIAQYCLELSSKDNKGMAR